MTRPSINPDALLRSVGLRRTPGRLAILGVLARASSPLSRAQIALRLKTQRLDKATLYRALDCFVRIGIVHRAFLRRREAFFELAHHCTERQCHPHFECTVCGRTRCLYDMAVPMLAVPADYLIRRQQIRLEGLCPNCR